MIQRWLSVAEISAHPDVTPDTIYKWVARKRKPALKLGRLGKSIASDVDLLVKAGRAVKDASPAQAFKRQLARRSQKRTAR
jgi:hypothetical protein